MTIEDIKNYIIRHNLNIASRKPEVIYQRMFLYAYLFHHHKWTLKKIATLFNKKDHVTVRHALIEAYHRQHYTEFIDTTVSIMEQTRFIIPEYAPRIKKQRVFKKSPDSFAVTVKLSKQKYITYLKTKDEDLIFDALWDLFIQKIRK